MKDQSKKDLLRLLGIYQQAIDLNIICSITDIEGTIVYVNKKFCEVSRFSEKELLGQNHNIVNSDFHPKDFFENLWNTIKRGDIWQGEVKSKAKDGSYFWLHSVIIPVFDESKNIVEFFSLRFPIDEKKKREEEKTEYIKSLEEMLFMISHKIRQPVANILGLTNLSEEDISSSEEIIKITGYMKDSALSLDNFTRELTAFIYNIAQKGKNRNCL